ncbi:DNA polymerase III subunit beta [Saccharopolyspora taberi]|uniref:DNA polymerase III subunit beta n=1 Tax=Saccharopolyspora taberi TaxID=60895 RepID=A0ABN3V560_9PSEU
MHITLADPRGFADAARGIAKLLASGPIDPVLAGIVLHAEPGGLTLSGFDRETATCITLDDTVEVETPGRVLVSGRLLGEIARLLPRQTTTLVTDDRQLTIVAGGSRATLPLLPIDDYPALPETPDVIGEVDAADFAAVAGRVASAAGTDEALPGLTGLGIDLPDSGEPLRLYATDRRRMATATLTWQPALGPALRARVLVPARPVTDAATLLASRGGTIRIGLDPDHRRLGLASDHRRITLAVLDVPAPPYDRVLATSPGSSFTAPVGELAAAVKRLALHREHPGMDITLADNTLRMEITSSAGTTVDTLAVDYTATPVHARLNTSLVAAALHALDSDLVHITLPRTANAAPKPWTLRPLTSTGPDDQLRYLVMPMTIPAQTAAAA